MQEGSPINDYFAVVRKENNKIRAGNRIGQRPTWMLVRAPEEDVGLSSAVSCLCHESGIEIPTTQLVLKYAVAAKSNGNYVGCAALEIIPAGDKSETSSTNRHTNESSLSSISASPSQQHQDESAIYTSASPAALFHKTQTNIKKKFFDDAASAVSSMGLKLLSYGGKPCHSEMAMLRFVVVAPNFRNQGMGVALIRSLLDLATQLSMEKVCCWAKDQQAVEFLTHVGFIRMDDSEIPSSIATVSSSHHTLMVTILDGRPTPNTGYQQQPGKTNIEDFWDVSVNNVVDAPGYLGHDESMMTPPSFYGEHLYRNQVSDLTA